MPLSGAINGAIINGLVINGTPPPEGVIAIGSGNLLSIQQSIGLTASGNILTIRQEVTSFEIGEGQLIYFQQDVRAAVSGGELVRINQIVTLSGGINPDPDSPIPHYIVRNGFYPLFTIGSYVWPDTQIHDQFLITGNEGDAKQLIFTLLYRKSTPYGTVDFEAFDGVTVTLDIYFLSGAIERIFTGRINKVDVDIIKGSITCTCDDDIRNKIINEYQSQTQNIGYYDKDVLGEASDTFELLEKRLSTVPQQVDIDRFGLIQLYNILPANSAHFTFEDDDVYGNNRQKPEPAVEKLIRSRVVNTVNISIDYQYQRRYHGTAHFEWDWSTDICEFLLEGESLAQRSTIQAAAEATGWVLNSNPSLPRGKKISFEEPPANGLYNCPGFPTPIAWSTVSVSGVKYEDATDSEGNPITIDGKKLKKATGGTFEDSRDLLAIGANWRMSYRWTQNVKETYNITLTAPQSILKYGIISQADQTGIDDSSDSEGWENYKTYSAFMTDDFEIEGAGDLLYYHNTPNRGRLYNAFNLLMNKAKTTIITSHRDNRVTFSIPLTPTLERHHTVYLNTDRLQAYGKVVYVSHHCTIADGDSYTTVTIALCRAVSSSSDSALSFPVIPTQEPPTPQFFVNLTSIYGEEPTENFKGFVGNRWKTEDDYTFGGRGSNTYKTNIQEQFIVKAPDIKEEYRNLIELTSGGIYTMSLPNNTLIVNFL